MDFQKVFFEFADQNPRGIFSFLALKELFEKSLTFEKSRFQRSDLFRSLTLSRHISCFVIDDDGDLILDKLDYCIKKAKESSYVLWDQNQSDHLFTDHLVLTLKRISADKKLIKKFKKILPPLCHEKAEQIVRKTLLLEDDQPIRKAEIKRAIFCTLLTLLRQSVGSCFATSCAIFVQSLQPRKVLEDLQQLLFTGVLQRVIFGKEYQVPFNSSMGMGDLKRLMNLRDLSLLVQSPSIIEAFEKVGLIEVTSSQKKEKIKDLFFKILEKKEVQTPYELIDEILLNHFSLTEEDFSAKKWEEKTEQLVTGSYHPQFLQTRKSPKRNKIEEYYHKKQALIDHICLTVDCPLLKCWEFTLASLCDVKREFTLWNLYTSLGLNHEEMGGLGQFLYKAIDRQLKEANDHLHLLYERVLGIEGKIRATETILYRTQIPTEEGRLRTELNTLTHQYQLSLDEKAELEKTTEGYQNLFVHLIKSYVGCFEEYFQEVYDPEMLDFPSSDYNDSPAGFRLVYTHGRKDPSTWTFIKDKEEFIQALRDFFVTTENRIISSFDYFLLHGKISELITEMIQFLISPVFIEEALSRVSGTHREFISHIEKVYKEKIEQKPWAYISGGTLETLAKTYFKKDSFSKKEGVVNTPEELFIFLVETMKDPELSLRKEKKFLMYNQEHACLFCPYLPSFKQFWQGEQTLQDVYKSAEEFLLQLHLTKEHQRDLLLEYFSFCPETKGHISTYIPQKDLSVREFKDNVISSIKIKPSSFDGFLHSALLSPRSQNFKELTIFFDLLPFDTDERRKKTEKLFLEKNPLGIFNALLFQKEVKKSLIESYESVCLPFNYHQAILKALEKLKWICVRPILFADTNWPCYYFGFVPNPLSLELELWRFDPLGIKGYPLGKEYIFPESNWGVVLEQLIYE